VRLAFVVELHRAAQVESIELDPANHQVKGERLEPDLEFLHVPFTTSCVEFLVAAATKLTT